MKQFTCLCSYVIEFTICSLCGWLFEESLELLVYHAYADRGILHLPMLPIYGFFGLILAALFRQQHSAAAVFCISTLVTTALELVSSYLLERMGYVLWDYSAWILNYEGRISLLSSLIFGAMSVLLVKCVHPLMRKMERNAPQWVTCGMGVMFGLLLIGDAVWTFLL